jgi:hypothetical protein
MHWLARTGRIFTALATLLAVGTADSFISSTATQRERHGIDVLAALVPQLQGAAHRGCHAGSTSR